MEAQAALEWTERGIVLHAPATEQPVLPIIHQDRKVHLHFGARLRKDQLMMMLQPNNLRSGKQLLKRLMKDVGRITVDPEIFKDHALILHRGRSAVRGSAFLIALLRHGELDFSDG